MAICRDSEGWRVGSSLRNFDFTLCFEEGVILSLLLLIVAVVAAFRVQQLYRLPPRDLTCRSRRLLGIKQAGPFHSSLYTFSEHVV